MLEVPIMKKGLTSAVHVLAKGKSPNPDGLMANLLISLSQYNSQQIISQQVDDTSFIVRAKEFNVHNLVRILHNFGIASGLEINLHKSVAYRCGEELHHIR